MTALYPYRIKEKRIRRKGILPNQLYDLTDLPECVLRQKNPNPLRKLLKKIARLKRASPFLITASFLPVLCIYWFLTQVTNAWILLLSFVFLQVNILFIDFALWNYYGRKKFFYTWIIEACLVFPLLYWFVIVNNIPPFIY
jgi:hypothetical protein